MNLIKQNLEATHFEKQNSKFVFEKRVPKPARIPPQTPPAGGIRSLFLFAEFGADILYVHYTALLQYNASFTNILLYGIRKKTWGKSKEASFEKEDVARRPCDGFEC
jgi:hypothetical protein